MPAKFAVNSSNKPAHMELPETAEVLTATEGEANYEAQSSLTASSPERFDGIKNAEKLVAKSNKKLVFKVGILINL